MIVLAYLSLLTLGLLDNIRGPFFPDILRDMNLDGTEGSAFFAVASLFAFFGSWLCHRLMRGRDPVKLLAYVSVSFAVGEFVMARSTQYSLLLSGCALFGWSYGSLNVLQNVIICEAAPSHRRRRLLNGLQSMYGLAALLAPLTATGLREAGLTWRTVFLVLSFLPLIIVGLASRHRGELRETVSEPSPKMNFKELLLSLGFAALLSLYLWGELSVSTRIVLWLRSNHFFSPAAADAQLAIFFVMLLAGRTTLAFVELKKISNWWILGLSACLSAVVYLVGLEISPYVLPLCGLTMAPFYPVVLDQAALTFGKKGPQAVGVIIGLGNLSIMAMHVVVGALTDQWGLPAALRCAPVALTLAGLGVIYFGFRQPRALPAGH